MRLLFYFHQLILAVGKQVVRLRGQTNCSAYLCSTCGASL